MSPIDDVKQCKRAMIAHYARPEDGMGTAQAVATLVPLALLWVLAYLTSHGSIWFTLLIGLLITLFTLRVFALMHECGHGSLFRSHRLNRAFGFVFGVIAGMPQYVWSQHHNYHHTHNGNWQRYRGPYTTHSIDEYEAMSPTQRRLYRQKCHISVAPLAGFIYLIFNPRFTWIKGSIALVGHVLRQKLARPGATLKSCASSFVTRYWKTRREYWHIFWNNAALLSLWGMMSLVMGPSRFFSVYLFTLSLAGGIGILLFTVQHNFEHSFASSDVGWDHDLGAIQGTSFLILPAWLNWFTANIGYHHVHHLSSRIPSYKLVQCHQEYERMFTDVTRLKLWQVPHALKCILWDSRAHRIISVAEYQQQLLQRTEPAQAGA